jgi:opacity protein-like surface antigen
MKRFLLVAAVFAWVASAAFAGSVCPPAAGSNFPHPPDPLATGCNVVITIAVGGGVSTVVTDSTPYENSEDVLVGVVNNSASTVSSLALTGSGVFGFDGDGICTFTFVGSSYCTAAQQAGTDPADYAGPTTTFAITNANTGTVSFSPAVPASGGTTYFSLEGQPSASLGVVVSTGPGGGGAVPAPSSITLLGIGFAVVLLIQAKRKFARA